MNHWKAPSQVLLLHDPDHDDHDHDDDSYGLTTAQRQLLLRQVQSVLETWTGVSLIPTFLYGIRIYREGNILAPHVDRYVYGYTVSNNILYDRKNEFVMIKCGDDERDDDSLVLLL